MIIWGTRGITFTLEDSQFQCPQCGGMQNGKLKHVRNFFTLYFIPIIPLNVAGRFVECSVCKGTFDEQILSYDPEKERQENEIRMLRVMVMAALADGKVDDLERGEIHKQYEEITGLPLVAATLAEEIKMATASGADLNAYAASFADTLTGKGKALLVKVAFHTMSASGTLQPGHQEQLMKLSDTLGIPEEQYMTLIDQISTIQ
jgi:uncharacterized tellurite resistance protein B-like protein